MTKNQKPLPEPPKDPLEERVDEMMDIHVPEASTEPPIEPAPEKPKIQVTVRHDDEPTNEASAPPVLPASAKKKKPVAITITHFDEPEAPVDAPKNDTEDTSQTPASIADIAAAANAELEQELKAADTSNESVDVSQAAENEDSKADDALESPPAVATAPLVSAEDVEPDGEVTPSSPAPENEKPVDAATPLQPVVPKADVEPTPIREVFNDPVTSRAVDDIIAKESDEVLEAEDLGRIPPPTPVKFAQTKPAAAPRRGHFGWLRSRGFRRAVGLTLIGLVAGAGLFPATRYAALNVAGVRSAASVVVVDESTLQPLKNVSVKIGDKTGNTDSNGVARFKELHLGTAQLSIQKRAFAPINRTITIGWGSNPLGSFNISPVGTQYAITVTDFVSGKPLAKVQVDATEANSQSDEKGSAKLTLDKSVTVDSIEATLNLPGYRQEKLALKLDNYQPVSVAMVPANKEVFISKRDGSYDVYAMYADGKDQQKILAGTGNEQESMVLAPSHDGAVAALVSTRDDIRNEDGFLESTLTLINLADMTSKTILHSEQIKIVDWVGTRLVYVQVAAGSSAASPNRQRLMSYDYKTTNNHQLVATNYFNDVLLVGGTVYYAPSSTYQAPGVAINFFSINPDGSNKQTVLVGETWNAFRTAYDKVVLSVTGQQWYSFTPKNTPTKLSGAPGNIASRVYVDSPDGKQSVWVENRDGKGVLLRYDPITKKDTPLITRSGLVLPIRWLNDTTVVFRVHTDQESADYAVSTQGGEPKKITDVTHTGGVDKWYYY